MLSYCLRVFAYSYICYYHLPFNSLKLLRIYTSSCKRIEITSRSCFNAKDNLAIVLIIFQSWPQFCHYVDCAMFMIKWVDHIFIFFPPLFCLWPHCSIVWSYACLYYQCNWNEHLSLALTSFQSRCAWLDGFIPHILRSPIMSLIPCMYMSIYIYINVPCS